MNEYDVWKLVCGIYHCGCCGRTPVYVDIRDMTRCPHCEHVMNYYETKEGVKPIRPDGSLFRTEVTFQGDPKDPIIVLVSTVEAVPEESA